ncbi:MAG: hypothetical protein WEB58_06385, partial [Planctomycetaceae bacterium]
GFRLDKALHNRREGAKKSKTIASASRPLSFASFASLRETCLSSGADIGHVRRFLQIDADENS